MTARTTAVGIGVTQPALTGSSWAFTTAVSPGFVFSAAIFLSSPALSFWIAGTKTGSREREQRRHSVEECHHHREANSLPWPPHFGCDSVVTATCMLDMRTGSWGTLDTRGVALGMME